MTGTLEELEKARAAKKKAKSALAHLDPGGIGLTRHAGRYAVKVLLRNDDNDGKSRPESIDGVPVVYQVVGRVRKQTPPGGGK